MHRALSSFQSVCLLQQPAVLESHLAGLPAGKWLLIASVATNWPAHSASGTTRWRCHCWSRSSACLRNSHSCSTCSQFQHIPVWPGLLPSVASAAGMATKAAQPSHQLQNSYHLNASAFPLGCLAYSSLVCSIAETQLLGQII